MENRLRTLLEQAAGAYDSIVEEIVTGCDYYKDKTIKFVSNCYHILPRTQMQI